MARREQDDLGSVGGLRARAIHVGSETRLGRPQVEPGQRVEGLAQGRGVGPDERRQLVEDPRDLFLLRHLGLAPGVPELDRDERLDEQRLAAARGVVDDALDPGAGLGLDRHDVAAVAQRHDRFLEGVPELGADEGIQAPPQPVVRHPDRGAQAPEPRRGRVEHLADRVEAARERAPDRRQGMQLATEVAQQRSPLVGEGRRKPRGRIERLGELEELGGIEATAAGGSFDRRADVVGRPDPDPRSILEQRSRLVGLVELAGDDDWVGRRLEGFRQPARRRERRGRREPLANERELEQGLRAGVHQPVGGAAGARPPSRHAEAGPETER